MQVEKWGDSLVVRLPETVIETMHLKEGDSLSVEATGARSFKVEKTMTREEALAELRALRRPLPEGYRFDRDEANAR